MDFATEILHAASRTARRSRLLALPALAVLLLCFPSIDAIAADAGSLPPLPPPLQAPSPTRESPPSKSNSPASGPTHTAPADAEAAPAVDDDIRGIKGGVAIPDPLRWWKRAGLAAAALAVMAAAWHLLRRQKASPLPALPARILLRNEFAGIKKTIDEPGEFAGRLALWGRRWLTARLDLDAEHLTTEALLEFLNETDRLPSDIKEGIIELLRATDRIRFSPHPVFPPDLKALANRCESLLADLDRGTESGDAPSPAAPPRSRQRETAA